MRPLHNCAEGADLHAAPAVDAFFQIDEPGAVLFLGNGVYRTDIRTGNGRKHNGVIGAGLEAHAALDAFVGVDVRLAVQRADGPFGAVHDARTRGAAPAHVGHGVLGFGAGAACFMDDGIVFFVDTLPGQRPGSEFGKMDEVDLFAFDFKTENGSDLVLHDVAILVHAATEGKGVARAFFNGNGRHL